MITLATKFKKTATPYAVLVAAVFLSAAIVRLYGLGAYALNGDEMQFLIIARGNTLADVWHRGLIELHPPLAQFIRHYTLMLSDNVLVQRLWGIGASFIALAGSYRIGCLLRGRTLGLFFALCMALFPIPVSTSITVRNYAFFSAFFLWALYYYARYRQSGSGKMLAAYLSLILLASATHFTGFFLAAACGIGETWHLLRHKRYKTLALFFLCHVPLFCLGLFFYQHYLAPGTAGPMWNNLVVATQDYPRDFTGRSRQTLLAVYGFFLPVTSLLDQDWVHDHDRVMAASLIGALILMIFYIFSLMKVARAAPQLFFLIVSLWVITLTASCAGIYPFGNNRHMLYLIPFVIVPYGYALEPIMQKIIATRRSSYVCAVFIVAVAIALGYSEGYLTFAGEFPLKTLELEQGKNYLLTHIVPGDVIVTGRIDAYFYLLYDHDKGVTPYHPYNGFPYANGTKILAAYDPPSKPDSDSLFRAALQKSLASGEVSSHGNIWFVMYGWKNIEIWTLLNCAPLEHGIRQYFSRDGVVIFAVAAPVLSALVNDDADWNLCYRDYKPLEIGEPFLTVKRPSP